MKRALLLAGLIAVGCGGSSRVDTGYVVEKRYEEAYIRNGMMYCAQGVPIGTTGVTACVLWRTPQEYVPEAWVLTVTPCEVYDDRATECRPSDVYVTADEWRRLDVGMRWDRAA